MQQRLTFISKKCQNTYSYSLCKRYVSSSVNIAQMRVGHYFKISGELYELVSTRRVVFGRSPAYFLIDYRSVRDPSTLLKARYPPEHHLDKIYLDRVDATFLYLEKNNKSFVVADKNYNEIVLPVSLLPETAKNMLQGGDLVTLWIDEGEYKSVTLPSSVTSKILQKCH